MLRVALFLLVFSTPLWAAERVALVIGNADYQVGRLRNPVNDANDIAASLRAIGFDVVLGTNIGREDMLRKLSEFRGKLQPGGMAVVYYSGHGVEVDGQNWLLPVSNANIQTQSDVPIYSVSAQDVLRKMEEGDAKLNLLILDACRDNPLPAGAKSASRGLAPINSGSSTLVAYATAPGKTAADGDGRNSPYTAVLKEALKTKGLSVTDLVNQVGARVQNGSGGAQIPWNSGTPIWPPIYLAGTTPSAPTSTVVASDGELRIDVVPASAQVRVDGALVIGASKSVRQPAGKTVVIRAEADGYDALEERVLIQGGQMSPVCLRLNRKLAADQVDETQLSPERLAYETAFEALKQSRYNESIQLFSAFLEQFPDGDDAAIAMYWLGESYYVTQNFQSALENFQRQLLHFPDSRKSGDSLLKVGYCQYELGDADGAAKTLKSVISQYPDTPVARLATGRLRALRLD